MRKVESMHDMAAKEDYSDSGVGHTPKADHDVESVS